jgi:transposase-like protein
VFGGIDRLTGKCFLVPVPDRKAKTLLALIKKWILPGSIIISDCWSSYNKIK